MSLRDRCFQMVLQLQCGNINSSGTLVFDPNSALVDDLMAFVIAENARAHDHRLDDKLPLCLYFKNDEDRQEFVEMWKCAHPGAKTRKVP